MVKMPKYLVVAFLVCHTAASAWAPGVAKCRWQRPVSARQNAQKNTEDSWDDDVNYEKDFDKLLDAASSSPEPTSEWNAPKPQETLTPKLGIDLGAMLDPLSEKEAAELKAAATEVINDAVASGIDEIAKVRENMRRELERRSKAMAAASDFQAERETTKLMGKIDALTDAFLSTTEASRATTKLAASADKATAGIGVEVGSWGVLNGVTVSTSGTMSLLGSIVSAQYERPDKDSTSVKRLVIWADTNQDPYAKKLVSSVTEELQKSLPGLEVEVYSPTANLPIGGDNAACVLVFLTSLSDKSSVVNGLDRLLRKTLQPGGAVGDPPTQVVAVSTLGTERTNKMPYSMQNLMGGKLDKRRQMEESIITFVRNRVTEPALDFTIVKLGELKASKEAFQLDAGDVLDGTTSAETAATILTQAIAFQPPARNATLSIVGDLPSSWEQDYLDDVFLKLDGPELTRVELSKDPDSDFIQFSEYLREWAFLLAESGKGLTTPIYAEVSRLEGAVPGVKTQTGVKILFLATATGKNYSSRDEERKREQTGRGGTSSIPRRKTAKEGGIEIVAEITTEDVLRVRAKRCNYADDAVIKELSESTILSRLRDGLEAWKKDHKR